MHRTIALGICVWAFGVAACGDDDGSPAGPTTATGAATGGTTSSGGAGGFTSVGGSGGETSAVGGAGGTGGAGGAGGAAGGAGGQACTPPVAEVDGNGCLTFSAGNAVCTDAVCAKAVACGVSTGDVNQCHIDCSQGVVVGECYTQDDVNCVYNAVVCDDSCGALEACHWPFF